MPFIYGKRSEQGGGGARPRYADIEKEFRRAGEGRKEGGERMHV